MWKDRTYNSDVYTMIKISEIAKYNWGFNREALIGLVVHIRGMQNVRWTFGVALSLIPITLVARRI